MTSALVVGAALALGSLAWVLYPLFFESRRPARARHRRPAPEHAEDSAIVALREIEFDRATGKLAEADYASLKTRYTREALAVMRAGAPTAVAPASDEAEAALLAYRARRASAQGTPTCVTCGPRPEPDARWCSTCGHFLPGACAACQAPVGEAGARFCGNCGHALAA